MTVTGARTVGVPDGVLADIVLARRHPVVWHLVVWHPVVRHPVVWHLIVVRSMRLNAPQHISTRFDALKTIRRRTNRPR